MQRQRAMSWRIVGKAAQALAAHALLFCFTLFLALKIDGRTSYSWWIIFVPLWLFHAVVARGRFSLPAPSLPHDRHWAPCHAVVATPLLIAFELLLCIYLYSTSVNGEHAVNLKIVFLPLLAFEIIILVDNFRMCRALMPGDEESMSDEAIWETLPVSSLELVLNIFSFPALPHLISLALLVPPLDLGVIFIPTSCEACGTRALKDWHSDCRKFIGTFHDTCSFFLLLLPHRGYMNWHANTLGIHMWSTLLHHFWVAISMVFLMAATIFTLLKLCGDVDALGWWDLFINFGIAECFAFLVCTKWSNPMIHRRPYHEEPCSSSTMIRYRDWNSSLLLSSMEDHDQDRLCSLQDIGGHIMKVPLVVFQVLLCMHLEGTPPGARHIPILALFLPLFLLQGAGVLYAVSRLVEKLVLLVHNGTVDSRYLRISSRAHDFFAFLHHGSRLLGWWSIDEGSKEEQARLFHAEATGYNTFVGYPPEVVKKMAKKDLAEEVWRLQAALGEQSEITKYSQQEYERLQNEKVLCRICYEAEICVVLLPCRHRILCKSCSERCKKCPICRVPIEERMPVYDV